RESPANSRNSVAVPWSKAANVAWLYPDRTRSCRTPNQREGNCMAHRIAVFGVGYVGCVSAACLSRDGHRVVGVDVDADKIAELNAGCVPVSEPGLAEIVREQ